MNTIAIEFSAKKEDIPGILNEISRLVELGCDEAAATEGDCIYSVADVDPTSPTIGAKKKWEGYVTVSKTDENAELSDAEDVGVDGTEARYTVEAFTEAGATEKVKDLFHDDYAIGCLDDFDIDVEVKECAAAAVPDSK